METNSEPWGAVVVYLTAADIAAHFGVPANTVHLWRARYGAGRRAGGVAKAPARPQTEPVRGGVKRPVAVWSEGRLAGWNGWRASRPGRGAGGRRPAGS